MSMHAHRCPRPHHSHSVKQAPSPSLLYFSFINKHIHLHVQHLLFPSHIYTQAFPVSNNLLSHTHTGLLKHCPMLVFGVTGRIEGAVKFTVDQLSLAISTVDSYSLSRERPLAQQATEHAQDILSEKVPESSLGIFLYSRQC